MVEDGIGGTELDVRQRHPRMVAPGVFRCLALHLTPPHPSTSTPCIRLTDVVRCARAPVVRALVGRFRLGDPFPGRTPATGDTNLGPQRLEGSEMARKKSPQARTFSPMDPTAALHCSLRAGGHRLVMDRDIGGRHCLDCPYRDGPLTSTFLMLSDGLPRVVPEASFIKRGLNVLYGKRVQG